MPVPLRVYWELARPFTLLMPALGMLTGGLIALGASIPGGTNTGAFASPYAASGIEVAWRLFLGSILAMVLNAASNALNQVYDLAADKINKPTRPLPAGQIEIRQIRRFYAIAYAVALALAFYLGPVCGVLVSIAAACTWIYSAPPLRTKKHFVSANITIALARGLLLKVAGWSVLKPVTAIEPWLLGSVFFFFLLGASSVKDFSDVEGDRAMGCRTLPVVYGNALAIKIMAPFYIFPFLIFPLGIELDYIGGNARILNGLAAVLVVWGGMTLLQLRAQAKISSIDGNHPAWKHMYLMMLTLQIGTAVAYLI